jgi:hypothetical protein
MQNDKIAWSWIPNKSNVERWNQERKSITQKNLKKMRVEIKNNNKREKKFQLEG